MKFFRAGAVVCLMLFLPIPASADEAAQHFDFPVTGDTFNCQGENYTIIAGVVRATVHEGESTSGNLNFTATFTPDQVTAEDSTGKLVDIRGAIWFGGTFNSKRKTEQFGFTGKLEFVDRGSGVVDSVNQTFHVTSVNQNFKSFDFGTCLLP